MDLKYKFNDNGFGWISNRLVGMNPQEVGEYLEDLRKENFGILTSSIVLEASRDPDSLLHDCFEWDDTEAAEMYRITQASNIIRTVRVTVVPTERKNVNASVRVDKEYQNQKPVKAFTSLRTGKKNVGYISMAEGLKRPDVRIKILNKAKKELDYWAENYQHLNEFAGVIREINKLPAVY